MHHPFTRPKAEDMPLFDAKKFPEVRAEAYDVVLNGVEIGGGSMRIYEPELQDKMFEALGITSDTIKNHSLAICCALSARRAAAWRDRARLRSPGDADLRRTKYSRCDGFPEKQPQHGSHEPVAFRSRSKAVARLGNQSGGRQKVCSARASVSHS